MAAVGAKAVERIWKLIRLALDQPESEEGRSAAVQALRLLHGAGLELVPADELKALRARAVAPVMTASGPTASGPLTYDTVKEAIKRARAAAATGTVRDEPGRWWEPRAPWVQWDEVYGVDWNAARTAAQAACSHARDTYEPIRNAWVCDACGRVEPAEVRAARRGSGASSST